MELIKKYWVYIIKKLASIGWHTSRKITDTDKDYIRELLTNDYYIILTWNSNHLSSYMISLANLLLGQKPGKWSHVLMNLENTVTNDKDFILVESISVGAKKSEFDTVFDVTGVAILRPRHLSVSEWTSVLDSALLNLGKPYDNLFDLKDDKAVSCVELVRLCLKGVSGYDDKFARFEEMIKESRNLTPQMFYDCSDFEVVFEVRR